SSTGERRGGSELLPTPSWAAAARSRTEEGLLVRCRPQQVHRGADDVVVTVQALRHPLLSPLSPGDLHRQLSIDETAGLLELLPGDLHTLYDQRIEEGALHLRRDGEIGLDRRVGPDVVHREAEHHVIVLRAGFGGGL